MIVGLEKAKPIATFKGRRAKGVVARFKTWPQAERDRVEVVVLDMSKLFFAGGQERCCTSKAIMTPALVGKAGLISGGVRPGHARRGRPETDSNVMGPSLCGSASMSHNAFMTSEPMKTQEASP